MRLAWLNFANLFYYLAYFCYYLWIPLHFLILFISLTILFQLIFIFIYSTFSKKFSINLMIKMRIDLKCRNQECIFAFIVCWSLSLSPQAFFESASTLDRRELIGRICWDWLGWSCAILKKNARTQALKYTYLLVK